MTLTYPLHVEALPDIDEVGGKGSSLIQLTQQGFSVPPGFILTVEFFKPWISEIQATEEWEAVLQSSPETLSQKCSALKQVGMKLRLDKFHQQHLAQALQRLKTNGGPPLFAVRSSSPEEDLEEASFAGGYETMLGVKPGEIEEAIRRAFASCFDTRVFVYKQEHGFAIDHLTIAVIVQQQIASEVAGVAFSLNPINNCYDEAVINANFGLGESVVSGIASPDTFIVDKVSSTILERKYGAKEISIWLSPDGGTHQKATAQPSQSSLTDAEILQLTHILNKVEAYYQKPIDIEWALANGNLYLLQARPITTYVPLPETIRTDPGEPKHLYVDLTLTKWGMQEPLSVMGADYISIANEIMLRLTMGKIQAGVVNLLRPTVGGRTYVNTSISSKVQGKKRLADNFRSMDTLTADIFENLDEAVYLPKHLPRPLRGILLKMVMQNLGMAWNGFMALRNPEAHRAAYLQAEVQLEKDLERITTTNHLTIREFAEGMMNQLLPYLHKFFPLIIASEIAKARIKNLFKEESPEIRGKVIYLERALPDNITIEMGLAMYHLAQFEEIRTCSSGREFITHLETCAFSTEFLRAWDNFIEMYGFRCPMEMDPATVRPYENPLHIFEQLKCMAENTDPERNPQAVYDQAKAERETAYRTLYETAQKRSRRKAKQFEAFYRTLITLGGYREKPKYYFVLITDLFRRHVLAAASSLVKSGALTSQEQVFDLHIDDLDHGMIDPPIDLHLLAEKNTRFLKKLRHVREFPRVIDSRGKIIRPRQKELQEGEWIGDPISPGIVRGRVKVLRRPDEKPILPGEILVARATDPGWTPLFLNASGVILEVGGMLQHGALVAREYGKPCIAGLENATEVLKDGQLIEMNGGSGKLTLVESHADAPLPAAPPDADFWNDSLKGDYLWIDTGGIYPDVMTPSTASVWKSFLVALQIGDLTEMGLIGGRLYANASLIYSIFRKFGKSHESALAFIEVRLGPIPKHVEIPTVSIPTTKLIAAFLPLFIKVVPKQIKLRGKMDAVIASAPERCRELRTQIQSTQEKDTLVSIWAEEIWPLYEDLFILQDIINDNYFDPYISLQQDVHKQLGERSAKALLGMISGGAERMASLGPLIGLHQIAQGKLSRESYMQQYGHRHPNENELSVPRPYEDSQWLEKQLADFEKSSVDLDKILRKRNAQFDAFWRELEHKHGQKLAGLKKSIDKIAEAMRQREAIRSELTRTIGVIREWFLRAGALTGLNDDIFFLTYQEVLTLLDGMTSVIEQIPMRRMSYEYYRDLPPTPSIIRGQFDPARWAANPNRRRDIFDTHVARLSTPETNILTGHPGSSGRAEGLVRRIDDPEEGSQLQPGEILVAITTNVGWTPIFPKAAAVITDVGAPLAHAAIVARELGIPAVVGCGDATLRLKTGDRVLVDGTQGIVKILESHVSGS